MSKTDFRHNISTFSSKDDQHYLKIWRDQLAAKYNEEHRKPKNEGQRVSIDMATLFDNGNIPPTLKLALKNLCLQLLKSTESELKESQPRYKAKFSGYITTGLDCFFELIKGIQYQATKEKPELSFKQKSSTTVPPDVMWQLYTSWLSYLLALLLSTMNENGLDSGYIHQQALCNNVLSECRHLFYPEQRFCIITETTPPTDDKAIELDAIYFKKINDSHWQIFHKPETNNSPTKDGKQETHNPIPTRENATALDTLLTEIKEISGAPNGERFLITKECFPQWSGLNTILKEAMPELKSSCDPKHHKQRVLTRLKQKTNPTQTNLIMVRSQAPLQLTSSPMAIVHQIFYQIQSECNLDQTTKRSVDTAFNEAIHNSYSSLYPTHEVPKSIKALKRITPPENQYEFQDQITIATRFITTLRTINDRTIHTILNTAESLIQSSKMIAPPESDPEKMTISHIPEEIKIPYNPPNRLTPVIQHILQCYLSNHSSISHGYNRAAHLQRKLSQNTQETQHLKYFLQTGRVLGIDDCENEANNLHNPSINLRYLILSKIENTARTAARNNDKPLLTTCLGLLPQEPWLTTNRTLNRHLAAYYRQPEGSSTLKRQLHDIKDNPIAYQEKIKAFLKDGIVQETKADDTISKIRTNDTITLRNTLLHKLQKSAENAILMGDEKRRNAINDSMPDLLYVAIMRGINTCLEMDNISNTDRDSAQQLIRNFNIIHPDSLANYIRAFLSTNNTVDTNNIHAKLRDQILKSIKTEAEHAHKRQHIACKNRLNDALPDPILMAGIHATQTYLQLHRSGEEQMRAKILKQNCQQELARLSHPNEARPEPNTSIIATLLDHGHFATDTYPEPSSTLRKLVVTHILLAANDARKRGDNESSQRLEKQIFNPDEGYQPMYPTNKQGTSNNDHKSPAPQKKNAFAQEDQKTTKPQYPKAPFLLIAIKPNLQKIKAAAIDLYQRYPFHENTDQFYTLRELKYELEGPINFKDYYKLEKNGRENKKSGFDHSICALKTFFQKMQCTPSELLSNTGLIKFHCFTTIRNILQDTKSSHPDDYEKLNKQACHLIQSQTGCEKTYQSMSRYLAFLIRDDKTKTKPHQQQKPEHPSSYQLFQSFIDNIISAIGSYKEKHQTFCLKSRDYQFAEELEHKLNTAKNNREKINLILCFLEYGNLEKSSGFFSRSNSELKQYITRAVINFNPNQSAKNESRSNPVTMNSTLCTEYKSTPNPTTQKPAWFFIQQIRTAAYRVDKSFLSTDIETNSKLSNLAVNLEKEVHTYLTQYKGDEQRDESKQTLGGDRALLFLEQLRSANESTKGQFIKAIKYFVEYGEVKDSQANHCSLFSRIPSLQPSIQLHQMICKAILKFQLPPNDNSPAAIYVRDIQQHTQKYFTPRPDRPRPEQLSRRTSRTDLRKRRTSSNETNPFMSNSW